MIVSIVLYIVMGSSGSFITDVVNSSKTAVQNVIELLGMMCFWSGIFNILEKTEAINKISKKASKLFIKLFEKDEMTPEAEKYISLNMVSNIIGVGNAATINGIKAMEEMQKVNHDKKRPNDNMAIFVLLNTASIQLIPTSMIGMRAMYGASNPGSITIPVIVISVCGLLVGLVAIKILNKKMV